MSEPLLRLLGIGLLTLLYLFFARILWVTRSQLREANKAEKKPAPKPQSPKQLILTITEPPEQRGKSYSVAQSATIGRATSASIVLDDDYASQFHARVYLDNGAYFVEDTGSTNGTTLNSKTLTKPVKVSLGDTIQTGAVTFEITA